MRPAPSIVATLAVALGAASGCAKSAPTGPPVESAPSTKAVAKPQRSASLVTPGRLFVLPSETASAYVSVEADGARRFVAYGMRLHERADGSLERSEQLLPADRPTRALELPSRLGGGFLFYVDMSGKTNVWRAQTFTGKLEPFARLDGDVGQIFAGFDRLYVMDRRAGDVIALDPQSGAITDAGALPPAPGYGAMAFADGWLGAVDVPFRGVLLSFDAGASWRALGDSSLGVGLDEEELVVRTTQGEFTVDNSGLLRQRGRGGTTDALFRGAGRGVGDAGRSQALDEDPAEDSATKAAPGPLGKRPLRLAALRGWPDSSGTAIVAHEGALGRVRLSDGKLLDSDTRAYPGGGSCQGVPFGSTFGFVCGEERGRTAVYAFEPPRALRPVLSFAEPRYVAASGNGALVVRGACPASRSRVGGTYCLVARDGSLREIVVRGDLGVERVVALRDGRAAVLVPPRLGAPGLLTLVDAGGKATSVKLKLAAKEAALLSLLKKGLWLEGFVETKPGVLSGWVVGSGPFVGVRIELDGSVEIGKLQHDIDRAVLSAELALVLVRAGEALESVDNGFTWRSVELPAGLGGAPGHATTLGADRAEQGCSRVGCAFSTWMRVGWGGRGEEERLDNAEVPQDTLRPSPGGSRWLLHCAPTGELSAPAKASAAVGVTRPPRRRFAVPPRPDEELPSSGWLPFLEQPPPPRRIDEVGFDQGTEPDAVQLRAYAWGARGASWGRVGHFQAKVADRFALAGGVWATEVTRSRWDDAAAAAQTFGSDPAASPTYWRASLEPGGRAAALLVSTRGSQELYLLEEERSITAVRDTAKWSIGEPFSVVKLGSTWYLGTLASAQSYRIFVIEGDHMSVLHEYPVRIAGAHKPILVRNAKADSLAVALRTSGWFFHAIDKRTGEATSPLEIPPQMLAQLPPACGEDDDGWIIAGPGSPSVAPYVEFGGGAEAVRAHEIEARVIVSSLGACTDALAARADVAMPGALRRGAPSAAREQSIPLVLTDRAANGRRWGFRCGR